MKAVREEFHGIYQGDETYTWQQLYGWNYLTANVWLPSLSELVGTTGTEHPVSGVWNSAMQDVPNASQAYTVDRKGGTQWDWFVPFNQSGGAAEIWRLCKNEASWLRTSDAGQSQHAWAVTSNATISWAQLVTDSHAVHPVVCNQNLHNGLERAMMRKTKSRRLYTWSGHN